MIWLVTTVIKIISLLVLKTPRPIQLWVGRRLGDIWFYIVPIRRKVVLENIRRAFPEWQDDRVWKTARANYQNYGCGFIEFLMLPMMDTPDFQKLFVFVGKENYDKAFQQKKGVFLLTLHMGNWELMSSVSQFINIPLHVITKKFKASLLNEVWVSLRMNRGIKLIKEEKSTFDILRAVRQGEVVGFILDQFMGPPVGVRTKFFGHETGTQAGLALFAERTRAPVVPVYNVRLPNGQFQITFLEPIPFMEQGIRDKNISFMTQIYTSKIEDIIKAKPEQWMWLHRRWKPFRD